MSLQHKATRTALSTLRSTSRLPQTTTVKAVTFSSTPAQRDSHYDPPNGWLWGVPPGQKPEKEGWEGLWYWGFGGSLILGTVAYAFKPDTSIDTWALEEAKRRLQAEGTLPEEDTKF